MTLSLSLQAYTAELEAYTRAKDSPKGIRIEFPDLPSARHYQARLHQARVLDRKKNAEIYEKGMPMYGASEFDTLKCGLREDTDGKFWVYIQKMELALDRIEEIP